MKKMIDYNFSNLRKDIVSQLLYKRGIEENFKMLPYLGQGENIKTINFQSKTSEKAIVKLDKKCLFIKKIPWYCVDERSLDFIFKYYEKLCASMFPCPSVIKEKNGKILSKIGDDYYVCFDFIGGLEFSGNLSQAKSLGKYLAKLHKAKLNSDNIVPMENILESVLSLARISNVKNVGSIIAFASDNFKKMKHYKDYVTMNHGDVNPSNVVFDNSGNVSAFFDFDNLKYDNPIRDLAESLLSFSAVIYHKNTSNYKMIFNPFDEKIFTSILTAYQKELDNDKLFFDLIEDLQYAVNIIATEFYLLSFLKKNSLDDDEINYEKLKIPSLDLLFEKNIV